MFTNSTKKAINEGYDNLSAMVYGLVSTGLEYATGKFLGSATKKLKGGATNEYTNALTKAFSKITKNPKVASFFASGTSEFTEEFIQEYLDNINKLIILDKKTDSKDYLDVFTSSDVLASALYFGALGFVSGSVLNFGNNNFVDYRNDLDNTKLEITKNKNISSEEKTKKIRKSK